MRVLYVEDYAIQAQLLRDALRRRAPHIQIEIATHVAQALARLSDVESALRARRAGAAAAAEGAPAFDLVLADLSLPDGSGLEVLEHVRRRNLPLAVVMLTGSDDDERVQACRAAGADDFVSKQGPYLGSLPLRLQAALDRFRADPRFSPPC